MKTVRTMAALIALTASASGCIATPRPGASLADQSLDVANRFFDLGTQVAFDHGCPPEHIRVIRSQWYAVDLDVCGVVRRYKSFGSASGATIPTWLDVTSLYPASSLPPLPPPGWKPAEPVPAPDPNAPASGWLNPAPP